LAVAFEKALVVAGVLGVKGIALQRIEFALQRNAGAQVHSAMLLKRAFDGKRKSLPQRRTHRRPIKWARRGRKFHSAAMPPKFAAFREISRGVREISRSVREISRGVREISRSVR